MSNNSKMSEQLLNTLDALQARDGVTKDMTPNFSKDEYDKETGLWTGDPPEGYQPMEVPDIKVESKETAVQEFEHSDVRTDYVRVRDTTYAIQEATMFMMQQAAKLAAATEAPRAFSVFRELGELMRGLNKDLMDNQKNFKHVTVGEEPKTNDDTEVNVQTDANGNTRVTVGKTNRRSSRDLMEVARQLQAEKAAEDAQKKQAADEAAEAEFVEVEKDGDDASATTPTSN